MSALAAAAAPEVDRLALSVSRARDHDALKSAASAVGLDDLGQLPHLWDLLLAGTLTHVIAGLRGRYRAPGVVSAWIESMLDDRLLRLDGNLLIPTDRLLPVLHAFRDETADRAHEAWAGAPDAVAVATAGADRVIGATSDDHALATVHASAPRPADPFAGLYSRLLTLRYIRMADHAAAWGAHDLTAQQMTLFSSLWVGETVPADAPALGPLVDRGLALADGRGLTPEGRTLRETIEEDTVRRSARTYDALGADGGRFLDALRSLPSAAPRVRGS